MVEDLVAEEIQNAVLGFKVADDFAEISVFTSVKRHLLIICMLLKLELLAMFCL